MRRFLVKAVVGLIAAAAAMVGLGVTASSASAATIGVVVDTAGSATAGQSLMYAKQTYSVLEPNRDGSTTLLGVVVEASGKAGDSVTVTGSSFRVATAS